MEAVDAPDMMECFNPQSPNPVYQTSLQITASKGRVFRSRLTVNSDFKQIASKYFHEGRGYKETLMLAEAVTDNRKVIGYFFHFA